MAAPLADEHGFEVRSLAAPPQALYRHTAIETGGVVGFENVSDEDVRAFDEYGYLVVRDAFSPQQIADALAGIVDLIMGKYPGYDGVLYEAAARDLRDTLAPEDRQDTVRKLSYFVDYEARLHALATYPPMLSVLRRIIGDEPDMFQDMALLKPPKIGREKPWHQDNAYFNLPVETPVVGVWIALDEALIENGCMHIIPGTHRDGPVVHFKRRDWQICDTDVQVNHIVAVPLQPGSCLLFNGLLHHGTPPSRSAKRRRAVQYHYKPARVMLSDDDAARLAVFGEEGKDVYC
ncbi:MAG: phytanoyl-CoA dioxygenase family protein [Chloroflexi bacterium]|nr:MAG: phytanoyl-CoA dioxygenase family protein [Chloroflexota bacterium]